MKFAITTFKTVILSFTDGRIVSFAEAEAAIYIYKDDWESSS